MERTQRSAKAFKFGLRGGSSTPEAIRLREQPVFCWIPVLGATAKQSADNGLRIRLAQVKVLNCQLYEPVLIAGRQNARPSELFGRLDADFATAVQAGGAAPHPSALAATGAGAAARIYILDRDSHAVSAYA